MRVFYVLRDPRSTAAMRIAEGVEFSNGWCSVVWCSELTGVTIYQTREEMQKILEHGGQSRVVYADEISEEGDPDDDLLELRRQIEGAKVVRQEQAEAPPTVERTWMFGDSEIKITSNVVFEESAVRHLIQVEGMYHRARHLIDWLSQRPEASVEWAQAAFRELENILAEFPQDPNAELPPLEELQERLQHAMLPHRVISSPNTAARRVLEEMLSQELPDPAEEPPYDIEDTFGEEHDPWDPDGRW